MNLQLEYKLALATDRTKASHIELLNRPKGPKDLGRTKMRKGRENLFVRPKSLGRFMGEGR